MRYNMRDRITRPYPEDGKLWRALEDLKAKYDRMAEMHQPTKDMRQSRNVVPAKVYFANGSYGIVDYKEMWYIRESQLFPFNQKMKDRIKAFRADMHNQGIPICIVSRVWATEEMKVVLKRWINEQK
jgi:hypothetical protein